MSKLDIIIPVKNEAENIAELVQRIDQAMKRAKINYRMIFVDDHSTDATIKEIKKASIKHPIRLHIKKGKEGKAYSILEGAKLSKAGYLAMIDGDLQYPPETLVQMFRLMKKHGLVVANRKNYSSSFLRRTISKAYAFFFGRIVLGFNCDVQSGLKMFKDDVIEQIKKSEVNHWTIDMNLLRTATDLGYSLGQVETDFFDRKKSPSKMNLFRSSLEIGSSTVGLKIRKRRIYKIKPYFNESVLGAGFAHKKRRFITHTHLSQHQSALKTFQAWQKLIFLSVLGIITAGLVANPRITAIVLVAALSLIYLLDLIFSLYVLLKSLHFPPEIKTSLSEIKKLKGKKLPVYSILCPLYKEAVILPHFLKAISAIDWPKDKLDVLLLLEEDDEETRAAAKKLKLPSFVRTIIVPLSEPKTKPKACNYGLVRAKGDYVVIYDAEDRPDPLQLKKAYLAFNKLGPKIYCLQSKLNYYNKNQNLLTRIFTAEYSLWFDLILPGLQSIETIIPLGGTSNHFRTKDLEKLHAWDSFNVTEDCDLGARLFKAGYKTALIDSTTYEEANSKVGSWLRQRSRWIKGYLQTYLVHMRDPISFVKSHGIQAFIFQLVIGMRMVFTLINPILWLATISYFVAYSLIGPAIEAVYPAPVFYIAAISLILGNFISLYNYMIGCAKRKHWDVIKFVFLVPFYWLMSSIAAVIAFYQLFSKPHYWEKTTHGWHIQKKKKAKTVRQARVQVAFLGRERLKRLRSLTSGGLVSGGVLIAALMMANVFNFLYNAYLGRNISFEEFGLISVIGSFLYLLKVPLGALGNTMTHKSAYLLGKYQVPAKEFWSYIRKNSVKVSLLTSGLWVLVTPMVAEFFKAASPLPFLLFTPVWFFGTVLAIDRGFLTGNLKFGLIASVVVIEALVKFLLAVVFVRTGNAQWVYAAIPLAMILAFFMIGLATKKLKADKTPNSKANVPPSFPWRFFATSMLVGIASIAFISLDVILAKHYLSPQAAGEYALLSLVGKMVFFIGSLFTQFINPLVSRSEGADKNTEKMFYKLLLGTMFVVMAGFVVVGLFGRFSVVALFGSRANPIIHFLPIYTMAMASFAIAGTFVVYHQAKKHYFFAFVSSFMALAQVLAIIAYHKDIQTLVGITALTGVVYLIITVLFHFTYGKLIIIARNIIDFLGLFGQIRKSSKGRPGKLRILIFNWRDKKHLWAGGAEVYIHELAKQLLTKGHKVTVFCGNDGKNPRNETIDGIQIVRRGGFYTTYLWAFLYYIFRFRDQYDIVVDCENGIPFFTPLYVRVPKFLMIYHVHQEVFMENLLPPFSWIALFLEAKLMPWLYKGSEIITISESSKKAIMKHGLTKKNPTIVYGGVDLDKFIPGKKAKTPLILYLGRLKPYKNLPVLIRAFGQIVSKLPEAKLVIAGFGESKSVLEKLVKQLKIEKNVSFEGRVSEKEKIRLYQKAWVMVNPSTMEGWGITSIEANACGTAVVASDVPGLRDSVKNFQSGFLVKHDKPQAFSDSIFRIITNRCLRENLSKSSRDWALGFSWENSADSFLDFVGLTQKSKKQRMFLKQQLERI